MSGNQPRPICKAKANQTIAAMSGMDDVGRVFFRDGRVLRGIWPNKVAQTVELLQSGLIAELVDRGLFPRTAVVEDRLTGFAMTLEHEAIHPLVLPGEWTTGMFRDAALALLEVNKIARRFGYETKDAHLYNLAFVGTRPVFFDFGSIVPLRHPTQAWQAYGEFVRAARDPLVLSRRGPVMRQCLFDYLSEHDLTHEDYFRMRFGLPQRAARLLGRARGVYDKLLSVPGWPEEKIDRMNRPPWVKDLLRRIHASRAVQDRTSDFGRLQDKIHKLSRQDASTSRWSGYQRHLVDPHGRIVLDRRLDRVCEVIGSLQVKSVLELGGNMGALSYAVSQRRMAAKVTMTDMDEAAVESAYALFKDKAPDCAAAVIDFSEEGRSFRIPAIAERYRADMVVALALTHHLILSHGIDPINVVNRIARLCTQYALVEFMPLGLWDGYTTPPIPEWYSLNFFREQFERRFMIVGEEQLEPNRVLLIGRKRHDAIEA